MWFSHAVGQVNPGQALEGLRITTSYWKHWSIVLVVIVLVGMVCNWLLFNRERIFHMRRHSLV